MTTEELYIDLVKRSVQDRIYPDKTDYKHVHNWPQFAHTMLHIDRLDCIEHLMNDVIKKDIKGDFIETGVWRGGACILMRAILKAKGITDRKVYVADSFEGLPKPDAKKWPKDEGDDNWSWKELAIPLDEVKANFDVYSLLDNQVVFVKGWFEDTLTEISAERFAIIRLDGDMYGSTMEALLALYPKLSVGGYCIIDDYELLRSRWAMEDYRQGLSFV